MKKLKLLRHELLPSYPEENYVSNSCRYFYPDLGIEGIDIMVWNGKIARVDISNKQTRTISGAKVGDIKKQIQYIYPQRINIQPGFYGGDYLIYEPQGSAYKNYLLLFETFNGIVTTYRVGNIYHVESLVEGCS